MSIIFLNNVYFYVNTLSNRLQSYVPKNESIKRILLCIACIGVIVLNA